MTNAPSTITPLTLIRMTLDKTKGWTQAGKPLVVPINPADLSFSTSLPVASAHSSVSGTGTSAAGSVTRTLSLTLMLDSYEDFYGEATPNEANGIYLKYVSELEKLVTRDAQGVAPVVLLTWNNKQFVMASRDYEKATWDADNQGASTSFFATVSSFSVKYSLFHSDGTPLRGTVNMSLAETSMANPAQAQQ